MEEKIAGEAMAVRLGTLTGGVESGGSDHARKAIELLLGEDNLRESVAVEREWE